MRPIEPRQDDPREDSPRGSIVLRNLGGSHPLPYYTYLPDTFRRGNRLVVVVHGISRNAREHIVAFAPWARESGLALAAPLFNREHCRDFQQLGWTGAGWRADLLLRRVVDHVARQTGADEAAFALFGYSGGAQFAHRYALARPQDIASLATCAAGYYSMPSAELPFPYGLGCHGLKDDMRFHLDEFLALQTLTTVGLRDTHRDRSVRTSPELDALQGRNRVERAHRWVEALTVASAARGIRPRHRFATIKNAGHDFRNAIRSGLAETVWPHLAATGSGTVTTKPIRTTIDEQLQLRS